MNSITFPLVTSNIIKTSHTVSIELPPPLSSHHIFNQVSQCVHHRRESSREFNSECLAKKHIFQLSFCYYFLSRGFPHSFALLYLQACCSLGRCLCADETHFSPREGHDDERKIKYNIYDYLLTMLRHDIYIFCRVYKKREREC